MTRDGLVISLRAKTEAVKPAVLALEPKDMELARRIRGERA